MSLSVSVVNLFSHTCKD